ncbi:MAG: DUF4145 domain-containing protein [Thermoproteota archaeon]
MQKHDSSLDEIVNEKFKYTNLFLYTKKKMSTEVISVRISKELKKEAEKLNIDVKSVIEKALVAAIEQAKKKKLKEAINALLPGMKKVSEEGWVRLVKECRKER